jgi:hypothetical protein
VISLISVELRSCGGAVKLRSMLAGSVLKQKFHYVATALKGVADVLYRYALRLAASANAASHESPMPYDTM